MTFFVGVEGDETSMKIVGENDILLEYVLF